MIKGLRLADIPDLSCSAQTLQLVVKEGISSQRVVGDIIAKLKTCATHFSHSVLAKQHLSAIQKELVLLPAQHHSGCSHPLELHIAYVADDAGAEACPEPICRRTWQDCHTSCRTMGYCLKFD